MTNPTLHPQEAQLITDLVDRILATGWRITVDAGDETPELVTSTDRDEILQSLNATGDDVLTLTRPETTTGPQIRLVYGNEPHEVINDYSTSIAALVAPTEVLARSLADND